MKKWPPDSPASGKSIRRHHSPFCESTGPIVQEGFVAARIRILQDLQAQTLAGNRSHSPMIKCPPRWVRRYEPQSPPRPGLAPMSAANDSIIRNSGELNHSRKDRFLYEHKESKESLAGNRSSPAASPFRPSSSYDRKSELDVSCTPSTQSPQDTDTPIGMVNSSQEDGLTKQYTSSVRSAESINVTTAISPSSVESNSPGPEIHGPRPISANLADSSLFSKYFQQDSLEDGTHTGGDQHNRPHKPSRKSVADTLGSLVEREYLGRIDPGKTDTEPLLHDSMLPRAHTRDDKTDREIPSTGYEPTLSKYSSHQSLSGPNRKGARWYRDSSEFRRETPDIGPPLRLRPRQERKLAKTRKHCGPKTPSFERSSSNIEHRTAQGPTISSIGNRRAWSLSHVHRVEESNNEAIELRSFTRGNATFGREDSKRTISASAFSHKSTRSQSSDDDVTPKSNQHGMPSKAASFGPSSRRSGTGTSQTNRSASRSTSWFKKSWFNPFCGDKQSVVEDAFKECSTSTAGSRTTDGAQKAFTPSPEQPYWDNEPNRPVAGSNHEGRNSNSADTTVAQLVLGQQQSRKEDGIPTSMSPVSDPADQEKQSNCRFRSTRVSCPASHLSAVNDRAYAELPEASSPKYAKSSSGSSQMSANSRSVKVPARRSSKRAPTSPSKAASLTSTNSHELPLSSEENIPDKMPGFPSRPRRPASAASVEKSRPSVPSSVVSSSGSGGQAPTSRAGSIQHQPPVDYVKRGMKVRGRGIKKIQVIISFDGAEDLVIEAAADVGTVNGR